MKVIVIGDVHGRSEWKQIADLAILTTTPNLDTEYDEYIFLGDYVDSFTITGDKILENLKEIVQLKKNYPDKVTLLLGNHDLQYLFSYQTHGCSGFNSVFALDYQQVFRENRDLFGVIYQIKDYIFTHAGISNEWWLGCQNYYNLPLSKNFDAAFIADTFKTYKEGDKIPIFDVGFIRGGWAKRGGIFWADFKETYKDYLEGYNQVVGHTRVKKITNMPNDTFPEDMHWFEGSITYIDVLENIYENNSKEKTYLELEIN